VRVGHLGGLSSLSGLAWQVVMASAHLIGRVPTCRNLNTTHALSQISSLHNPHVIIPAFYLLRVFLELNLKTQYVESVLRVRSPSALCWKPCQVEFSSSCDRGVLLLTCARDNFVNTISLLFPTQTVGFSNFGGAHFVPLFIFPCCSPQHPSNSLTGRTSRQHIL
jgi:hypothetical protein